MKKLKVKTIKESSDLTKVYSSQALSKDKLLEIIDNAKKFEKGNGLNALRQIVDTYDKKEYHSKPGKFSEKINSTGETAFQRAIFNSKTTKLDTLAEVVWNDIELPVVFNESSRRNSVDLVGTLHNNILVLCELKFTSKKGDSPIYAAIELLIYYYLIQHNHKELDQKDVFHKNKDVKRFKWSNFNSNSVFIVAANETYWTNWIKQYEEQKIAIELWRRTLPVKIRFFSSPDFDFSKQKDIEEQKGSKGYRPNVPVKMEWTEVSL